MNAALSRVDDTMKTLVDGLRERGIEDCVNVIIVSDHGMTAYNSSKLVKLNSVSALITASTVRSTMLILIECKLKIITILTFVQFSGKDRHSLH